MTSARSCWSARNVFFPSVSGAPNGPTHRRPTHMNARCGLESLYQLRKGRVESNRNRGNYSFDKSQSSGSWQVRTSRPGCKMSTRSRSCWFGKMTAPERLNETHCRRTPQITSLDTTLGTTVFWLVSVHRPKAPSISMGTETSFYSMVTTPRPSSAPTQSSDSSSMTRQLSWMRYATHPIEWKSSTPTKGSKRACSSGSLSSCPKQRSLRASRGSRKTGHC
ncbi:MAG: hypothetical protein ACI8QC_003485 [Planctomycetota bacterium]|jgi:hypothetical protein